MKKILYFVCIMLFGVSIKASPLVDVQYQEGIYSNRIGNKLYSGKMAFIYLDNNIVYCLDPFELVGKTYYEDNSFLNKFNKYDIEYMELVAYYGYNETNRKSIYYYMAAQELIWERIIGGNNVYWTTGLDGTGDKIDIENYKNEILNNVDNFYKRLSFNNIFWQAPIFETDFVTDKNNVLNDYEIISNGKNIVTKNNNRLYVKFLDMTRQDIILTKKIKTDNKTTIYKQDGNQTLAKFGIDVERTGKLTIQATYPYRTKLNLTLYDKNTNKKLNNVKFDVCNSNDIKMDAGWTNVDGKYTYNDKFDEGEYNLCMVPDGYIYTEDLKFKIDRNDFLEETNIDLYLTPNQLKPVIDEKPNIEIPIDKIEKEPNIPLNENIENLVSEDKSPEIKNEVIKKSESITINSNEKQLKELPNTNNYNYSKYLILCLMFMIGIISYEIQDNRN